MYEFYLPHPLLHLRLYYYSTAIGLWANISITDCCNLKAGITERPLYCFLTRLIHAYPTEREKNKNSDTLRQRKIGSGARRVSSKLNLVCTTAYYAKY